MPATNDRRAPAMTQQRRDGLRAKFDDVRVIFIDEISMLPSWMLSIINQILQDLYGDRFRRLGVDVPLFAGIHIILAGHFLQLPAVGAPNLMQAAIATPERDVDSHLGAGHIFRQFQRFSLTIPQRSSNDLSLGTFLSRCEDPLRYPRPFAMGILQPTCPNCALPEDVNRPAMVSQRQFRRRTTPRDHPPPAPNENNFDVCPSNCPHRCQHLKVLSREDVLSDPSWRRCYFTSPMNTSCDTWTRARLHDYAQRGETVLRWRLLPSASSAAVSELLNEEVEHIFGLWGYYLYQGPVCMTYNVNVPAGIGHHSEGRLVGIALEDDSIQEVNAIIHARQQSGARGGGMITLSKPPIAVLVRVTSLQDSSQASDIPTSAFVPRRDAREPPVITLSQGSAMADQNTAARKVRVSLGDMPSAVALDPALRSGSIAGRRRGTQQLTVDMIGTGYRLNFASTVHGLQGATVRGKLIADLNPNPAQRSSITVSGAYVTLSRVQTFDDIRVAPWQNGYGHLQALEHSRDYVLWEQCYDSEGRFNIERLPFHFPGANEPASGHRNVTPDGEASGRNNESVEAAPAIPTIANPEGGRQVQRTPTTPRHVSFQPVHQMLQPHAQPLTGPSSRTRNSSAGGRMQTSLRTTVTSSATPDANISRTSTVTPARRSRSAGGRMQSSARATSSAILGASLSRTSPITSPARPSGRGRNATGRIPSTSSRVGEASRQRPTLLSATAITYSKVYVPFLLQVLYPTRHPTPHDIPVINAINTILQQNDQIQTLYNEMGPDNDLTWNTLVELVRERLRGMIGEDMFIWVRDNLVANATYIEAIPQEILLGNLTRAGSLSLNSRYRDVAGRIQHSINDHHHGQNTLLDVSTLLDMACQRLALENPLLLR